MLETLCKSVFSNVYTVYNIVYTHLSVCLCLRIRTGRCGGYLSCCWMTLLTSPRSCCARPTWRPCTALTTSSSSVSRSPSGTASSWTSPASSQWKPSYRSSLRPPRTLRFAVPPCPGLQPMEVLKLAPVPKEHLLRPVRPTSFAYFDLFFLCTILFNVSVNISY
jgi:hypothetical protein